MDIGVHQDGLVHISELSNRYIKEPGDVVKVGQIVQVRVMSADAKTKRIALSMKSKEAPAPKQHKPAPPKQPVKQEPNMNEKLAALADRWKRR